MEVGISDQEAVRLIESPPDSVEEEKKDGWVQDITENTQTLQMGADEEISDPFTARLLNLEVRMNNFYLFI